MSSTPTTATQQSEGDGFLVATAAAQAYLEQIGLRPVLDHGVVRLLEMKPLPASALAAWFVLATEITRVIKAQGHGWSNDAVASALLAGFESLVRERERGQSRKGAVFVVAPPISCGRRSSASRTAARRHGHYCLCACRSLDPYSIPLPSLTGTSLHLTPLPPHPTPSG